MRRQISFSLLVGIFSMALVAPIVGATEVGQDDSVPLIETEQSSEAAQEESRSIIEEQPLVVDEPDVADLGSEDSVLNPGLFDLESYPAIDGYELSSVGRSTSSADRLDAPSVIGKGWSTVKPVFAGNADRVGTNDAFGITAAGDLLFYPRFSTGWGQTVKVGPGWNNMRDVVGGVDFTGDGNPDLVAIDSGCTLKLYHGNGRGGFGQVSTLGTGWCNMSKIAIAAKGPNGKPVVYSVTKDGGILYSYQTDGKGKIITSTKHGGGWQYMKTIFGVHDWDNNGYSEIIGVHNDGRLLLYKVNAAGMANPVVIGTGWANMRAVVNGVATSGRQAVWAVTQGGDLLEYTKHMDPAPSAHNRAADIALSMQGKPYIYGAASPSVGFDCSGLVSYAYQQAGIPFKPNWRLATGDIRNVSQVIRADQAQRGDMIYWPGHVAMYLTPTTMVHAPVPGSVVTIAPITNINGVAPVYLKYGR